MLCRKLSQPQLSCRGGHMDGLMLVRNSLFVQWQFEHNRNGESVEFDLSEPIFTIQLQFMLFLTKPKTNQDQHIYFVPLRRTLN